jgi:hypothetical protein
MCLSPYLSTGTLSKIIYVLKLMLSVHANTVLGIGTTLRKKIVRKCYRQHSSFSPHIS